VRRHRGRGRRGDGDARGGEELLFAKAMLANVEELAGGWTSHMAAAHWMVWTGMFSTQGERSTPRANDSTADCSS